MRTIKLIVIALILGLAGIVYAAGGQQTPAPADGKEKAASCCAKCSDSCCMKGQKAGDARTAHMSCDMNKSGEGCCSNKADCCQAKAACCKPGAECCKAGAECCKTGAECCAQKHTAHDAKGKAEACDMQKDGKGCCASCECCKDGSCDKDKMAGQ